MRGAFIVRVNPGFGLRSAGLLSGLLPLLLSLFLPAHAQDAANGPVIQPAPGWVEFIDVPQPAEELPRGINGGQYYLLLDSQHRLNGDTVDYYKHSAWLITDRAGLENSGRLSFDFDPTDQDLIIHAIRVWRDGVAQDRLRPGLFTTIRRETQLQSGMVDGDLTSFVELADIHVGDIIDYELTTHSRSQTWPGGYGAELPMAWSVPLARHHRSILAPADMPLTLRTNRSAAEPETRSTGGWVEYQWAQDDIAAIESEAGMPGDYTQRAYISVSNLEAWSDVIDWALPIYENGEGLPEAGEQRVTRIRREHATDAARITAAIRYVQDEFRYVADGIGVGGYVPRSPSRVIELGYGDCKDKSVLMVAMLRALGYDANVALTDIDRGLELAELAPSPHVFDHMIVQLNYQGQSYWIDATSSHQGGVFPNLVTPSLKYALPIRAGQTGLESIPLVESAIPDAEVVETFDMARLTEEGVALDVVSHFRGREANGYRANLSSRSVDEYSRNYLSYYRGQYPGIEPRADLVIDDDRDANVLTTTEAYLLPTTAHLEDDRHKTFALRADTVLNQLGTVEASERQHPIGLTFPSHRIHTQRLVNFTSQLFGIADVTMDEDFARYTLRSTSTPDQLEMTYVLQVHTGRASPDQAAAFNALADEIADSGNLTIDLSEPDGSWQEVLAWAGNPANERTLGLLMVAALYLILIPGALLGLNADKKMPEGARFYPVSLAKFTAMSILTMGLYQLLWMWRNWRWVKATQARDISPFGRSLFGAFFFLGLFQEVRNEAESGRGMPAFLGNALAIIYMVWVLSVRFADSFTSRLPELPVSWLGVILLLNLASFIWLLPTVQMINGLNREKPEIQRYNSRYTLGSWIAMLAGGAFLALALLGSFA